MDKTLREFFTKYPYADRTKFITDSIFGQSEPGVFFGPVGDSYIYTGDAEFKNNKDYTKYLTINKPPPRFPKAWLGGGHVQTLSKGKRHRSMYKTHGSYYYYDNFPVEYVLNYPVNKFRVYVNEAEYFQSDLPPLDIKTSSYSKWNLKEKYYQALVGTYVATYASGVSLLHLTPSDDVPPEVTSLLRFHLYFTIRRIMREFNVKSDSEISDIMRSYGATFLMENDKAPRWTWQEVEHTEDPEHSVTEWKGTRRLRDVSGDFKKFVPKTSDGLTSNGLLLLNQSIEAFIYSILGAQAKTKQSIYGDRASALETQKVFRQLVEDSIINYNTATWINNMNRAVTDTNVVLNLAVSPSLWLLPSNLIILKNPIAGYNNKLQVANDSMRFGVNHGVNYFTAHTNPDPKKTHQDGGNHLDSLDNTLPLKPTPTNRSLETATPTPKRSQRPAGRDGGPDNELGILLVLTAVSGYLFSKYVL